MSKKQKQLDAYLRAGLTEPFALAILEGIDPDEVLELWNQEWWKQYDSNDQLVSATLSGKLPQSDAKWLNEIRSDHQGLVSKCLDDEITLEWARVIMETGFRQDPDAVEMVLDGALPSVIAKLRGINDGEEVPPLSTILQKYNPSSIYAGISLTNRGGRFLGEEEIVQLFVELYGEKGKSRCEEMSLQKMLQWADKEGIIMIDDKDEDSTIQFKAKRGRKGYWFDAKFILVKPIAEDN